jgi:hypothetical protein
MLLITRRTFFAASLAIAGAVTASGCGDSGSTSPPATSVRVVRYELSGTYSKPLTVAYTSETGGITAADVTTLPWSRDITYNSNVGGLGFGGQSVTSNPGVAGQLVTLRVLSAGKQVLSVPATANANGLVNIPTQAYVFP